METRGLNPAQVRHLAPGTHVLLRAKFRGIDSINALAQVTVSNRPVSIRAADVVAEILPEPAPGVWGEKKALEKDVVKLPAKFPTKEEGVSSASVRRDPDYDPDDSSLEEGFAEPPVPIEEEVPTVAAPGENVVTEPLLGQPEGAAGEADQSTPAGT